MAGNINRVFHLAKSYFSALPAYLILFVTPRCNGRCKMCFNWKEQDGPGNELSLSEIEKISFGFKGLPQLTLGGGEPFLRDDIPRITECFYRDSGTRFLTISTNGFFTEKIAADVGEILKRCPDALLNVGLSMDGVGSLHDEIRGLEGSFQRLLETFRCLRLIRQKHRNFYIKITTVVSVFNSGRIEEIFDFVRKNMDVDEHEILLARGDTRFKEAKEVLPARYKHLVEIFNENSRLNLAKKKYQFSRLFCGLYGYCNNMVCEILEKRKMVLPCLAGRKLIEIYPDGTVRPCEILHTLPDVFDSAIGNIRDYDYDIRAALRSEKARAVLQHIKQTGCFCTFECAALANIVFSPRAWPGLIKNMLIRS